MEPTILDCDYEIEDKPKFLTVKWSRDDKTIYQWILGKAPAPIVCSLIKDLQIQKLNFIFQQPEFKNDVDSSYESSTDPHKQYSSLALINPTIETTGDYKCVVTTDTNSFTSHQRVQVVDVRNYTLNLHHNRIHNETQLECVVTNVYPRPTITIQ